MVDFVATFDATLASDVIPKASAGREERWNVRLEAEGAWSVPG